jgi:hypothetical protein
MSGIINTDLEEVLLSKRDAIEKMVDSIPKLSTESNKSHGTVPPEKIKLEELRTDLIGQDDLACDDEVCGLLTARSWE